MASSRDKQTYIPQQMQQAMTQHAQQSLPPHLQRFQNSGAPIPAHIERAMVDHMKKTAPAHMQQYVDPYVQQSITAPSYNSRAAAMHSPQSAALPPVHPSQTVFTPNQQQTYPGQPQPPQDFPAPPQPQQPGPPPPQPSAGQTPIPGQTSYDFIMNPQVAKKAPWSPPTIPGTGDNPLLSRVILFSAGLIVLLIIFSILRGILFPGPDYQPFVNVIQDQQELIHLSTNAALQPGLSPANRNLSATVQAALGSSQTKTIEYLLNNKVKIDQEQLNLKISTSLDKQLTDAAAAANYNETFEQVMKDQINTYAGNLQSAYKKAPGQKGRELLNDTYNQAQLLYGQLNSAATPASP